MHERPVVVVSGGGTGGHLYPALAIADELRALRPDVRAVFVGAERGLEARVLPQRGEEHLLLPVHGFDRSSVLANVRVGWELAAALVRVLGVLRRLRPEVVVVTGGYAGAAAGIGAGLLGLPLVLQEQNSLPGAVTKLLTRWATRIHIAYPEAADRLPLAPTRSTVLSGNPIRARSTADRSEARSRYEIPEDVQVVLVVGGSQGSLALNKVMLQLAEALSAGTIELPDRLHFLWATGVRHHGDVSDTLAALSDTSRLHVLPYFEDMPSALAAADLALSRSGAMSTAELLNQGLPAVLVPLPTSAEGHQMYNARALEAAGAAVVVPQDQLTAVVLAETLGAIAADEDALERMADRALARAKPDAAADIAADVARLLAPSENLA